MFSGIQRSIRRKLTTVILGTALVALLVTALAMVVYEARTYHQSWVSDLTTQADILGKSAEAALNFNDPKAASDNLAALRLRPQISAAAIYDGDGSLFATFARYALLDRLGHYLLITLFAVGASMLVALAVAYRLQATITRPILALTNAAREVMDRRDYSLRVIKTSQDEVGVLVDAFNAMLAEAGRRASALESANASLQHEMTERRAAEDALKAADRRKDEFLATLAHELRNPLAPISNSLQILSLADDLSPPVEQVREIMKRQVNHMVRLVDDLLEVSRITTGKLVLKRAPCNLGEILGTAVEAVRPLIEAKQHRLLLQIKDAQLDADGARLSQVFSNILNNAAKYTDPGGEITLRSRRVGDSIEVTVADTGIGIEREKLHLVFDMFMQFDTSLERAYGGLGVGMALAKRLVEMHGGTIKATSAGPGRGSTFIVTLPARTSTTGSDAPHMAAAAPTRKERRRVLVVDDNRDFATSLAAVLELDGHTVRLAFDGQSAMTLAHEFRPDLAFLDLGLPGLNGFDLARRLRAEPATRDTHLIALTGWGQDKDRAQTREAGFDLHFVKPVDPSAIAEVIERFAPTAPPSASV
jgi:two-component system, sensor histidine kinase